MARIPQDHGIQHAMSELLARHLAAANILGRMDVLGDAKRLTGKVLPFATSSRHHFAEEPTDPLKAGFAFDLPNDDAVDYIRNLTPVTRETFDGLASQYRRLSFTLAGTSDVRLITRVRDELAEVVKQGGSKPDFRTAIDKMTTDAGVAKINAFSLDSAFGTATHSAYSLGRYEQMTDKDTLDVLPYWMYMTVGDTHVRPEHAIIDGFTARGDDPIWHKIYPPNGFGCRCIVIARLPSQVQDSANEPGYARLPALAKLKVPQEGFGKVFDIAA